MLQYVHHVNYVVHNCDEMVEYFEKNFGMKPQQLGVREGGTMKEAIFQIDKTEIQISEPLDPQSGLAKHLATHGPGVYHVAWKINDARKAAKDLAAKGNKLRGEGGVNESSHGYLAINIQPESSHGLWFQLIDKT